MCRLTRTAHTGGTLAPILKNRHQVNKARILIILISMGLFSCFSKKDSDNNLVKPEINETFKDLIQTSYDYLNAQQDSCKTLYSLGSYERWDYKQETGLIEFSDSGIVKIRIKYEEVGSISTISKTWLWAWDNESLLPQIKSEIVKLRDFGVQNNYRRLTKPKWYGDEYDGWEMTAIAAKIMKAKGAYRIPTDKLYSFIIFKEIEDLREKK